MFSSFFSKRERRLLEACENGDADVVAKLLGEGVNINCQDKNGDTSLHKASWHGFEDIAQLLLQAGCTIYSKNQIGDTPLHNAAYNGHDKIVALFINAGALLESKNNDGWTPIHYAAHSGHEKAVALLINAGSSLEVKNKYMKTPLLLAFEMNHTAIVDIINATYSLLNAISSGNCEKALKLLQEGTCIGPVDNASLLHLAAKRNFPAIVELLVARNININHCDSAGKSALHEAAQVGSRSVVKILVNCPLINLNIEDSDGNTPLHTAARAGQSRVIGLLMYADFNRKNKNGKTALYIAAEIGNAAVVKELLQFQTDKRIQGPTGDTPLTIAKRNGHNDVVNLLESKVSRVPRVATTVTTNALSSTEGIKTSSPPADKKVESPAKSLEAPGSLPQMNTINKVSVPEVLKAVSEGESNAVQQQLNSGVDPNTTNEVGDTLLHIAVRSSQTNVLNLLLCAIGIDVKKRNQEGLTPLTLAIKLGHRHIAARIHACTLKAIISVPDSEIELDIAHNLGVGGFGTVYKGIFQNQTVAVKTAHADKEDALRQEINTMMQCPSPYVIGIVAVSDQRPKQLKLALEFMDCGDLRGYLDAKRENKPTKMNVSSLEVAWVVANALADIHHAGVIHRDLKSNNILLSTEYYIKLGDLGISREYSQSMTTRAGTPYWEAPEVLKSGHYDYAADIFSFGVILTEIDTLQLPYANCGLNLWTIIEKVSKGALKPSVSATCDPWLRELAEACLQLEPKQRPTAQNVVDFLRVQLENSQNPTTAKTTKKCYPQLSTTFSTASTASLSSSGSTSTKSLTKWTYLACKSCRSYNPMTSASCLKCSLPLPTASTKLSTLLKRVDVAKQRGFDIQSTIECEECLLDNPLTASICEHCQSPFPFQTDEEKLQELVNRFDMTPP